MSHIGISIQTLSINKLLFFPRSTVETRAMYVRKVNILSRDWLVMSKIRFRFVVREGRL